MILDIEPPRRQMIQLLANGPCIVSPRPEIATKRVKDQHAFEVIARRAACRSGQYGGPDRNADAETGGQHRPTRFDRGGQDASAHPPTPAVGTAAFQHISSDSDTAHAPSFRWIQFKLDGRAPTPASDPAGRLSGLMQRPG